MPASSQIWRFWQDPATTATLYLTALKLLEVGLVLSEGCHPAFFEAGFAAHFLIQTLAL